MTTDAGGPFIPAEWATALYEYARDAEADSLAMVYGWSAERRQQFVDLCSPEAFAMAIANGCAPRLTIAGVECFAPTDRCPADHDAQAPVWVRAFYAEHGVWPCEW